MKRILQIEVNERYFDQFAEAFIKSFYTYNRGWELYVVDLGLRDDQRSILSKYGRVEKYQPAKNSRWVQMPARMEAFAKLVRDDVLILHADVDMVALSNYDDLVQLLLEGNHDCLGSLWEPIGKFVRYMPGTSALFGVDSSDPVFLRSRVHLGCLLLRGTPRMTEMFEWLHKHWDELSLYVGEEECVIALALYTRGLSFKHVQFVDCIGDDFPKRPPAPSWLPHAHTPSHTEGPSRLVHFAYNKYFMWNTSVGNAHELALAWYDVLFRPYINMPWPDARVVG